ncbi:MAG: Na+-dependent transporter [Candidatus Methanoplasma sp.]|jgi:BASS family bile acid:Na+ symporter|nr:Na+-dependent transporter [Candidatus Methanoplasma sp.]
MKAVTLVCSSAFMMSLAVAVSLLVNFSGVLADTFSPSGTLNAGVRSNLTIFFLAVMMTISLSRIPSRNLSPAEDPKSLLRGVLMGLLVPSVIPIIGFLLITAYMPAYETHAWGLVFIAATPFAASVAPLSLILRGDMVHAARCTIYVYVAALLWIPLVVWAMLGKHVEMGSLAITVFEVIGIPIVLSRFLTKVRINKTAMAAVLNCTIFFLVWLSASAANFKGVGAGILVAFLLIAALRSFGLGILVDRAERRAGIGWSQRVTDILMTSYKNKGIALALCTGVLVGPVIGDAMVAITASIISEVAWVAFMDSVLFSKRRMALSLARESKVSESGNGS